MKRASARHGVVILIDPPSYHYYDNLFFDLETPLNRDNTLKPNFELKQTLEENGYPVFTADLYVEIKNSLSGKILYTKKITNSQNYKASSMYSDTVSKEKKIIEDVSSLMAKQIINEMSLSLRNDI